jgi:hypothetical protein
MFQLLVELFSIILLFGQGIRRQKFMEKNSNFNKSLRKKNNKKKNNKKRGNKISNSKCKREVKTIRRLRKMKIKNDKIMKFSYISTSKAFKF